MTASFSVGYVESMSENSDAFNRMTYNNNLLISRNLSYDYTEINAKTSQDFVQAGRK